MIIMMCIRAPTIAVQRMRNFLIMNTFGLQMDANPLKVLILFNLLFCSSSLPAKQEAARGYSLNEGRVCYTHVLTPVLGNRRLSEVRNLRAGTKYRCKP